MWPSPMHHNIHNHRHDHLDPSIHYTHPSIGRPHTLYKLHKILVKHYYNPFCKIHRRMNYSLYTFQCYLCRNLPRIGAHAQMYRLHNTCRRWLHHIYGSLGNQIQIRKLDSQDIYRLPRRVDTCQMHMKHNCIQLFPADNRDNLQE